MKRRQLGRTGLLVSELGFGALEIGRHWPYWRQNREDFSRPDEASAVRVLHAAVDHGINFFDTAPAYQDSERILGTAFKGMRGEVLIGTKCGEWFDGERSVYDYSYHETKRFIENSLRQLQTEYVDLLQIHSASLEVVRKGETLAAMQEAKKEGKVRFLGLSTEDVTAALEAVSSGAFDAVQVSYNAVNSLFAREVFDAARAAGVGIIVKDAVARGKLSPKLADVTDTAERTELERLRGIAADAGMSLTELALRFVLSDGRVSTLIAGTKRLEHLSMNAASAGRGALPDDVLRRIAGTER